jgi:nucleotide-binding universal stress UspA family protein
MVVVAAVDRSEEAKALVDEALEIADGLGEDVHVVHAVDSADFAELQREHVSSTADEEGILVRDEVAAKLADDTVSEADDRVTIVGLEGEPADSIIEYANDVDARYIVVGGHKRSPAGKALFGNTTQSVLLGTERVVVVVPLSG